MARNERFTFLCNAQERAAIARLAKQLKRSQSDAIRFVVIEAAQQLSQKETSTHSTVFEMNGKEEKRNV